FETALGRSRRPAGWRYEVRKTMEETMEGKSMTKRFRFAGAMLVLAGLMTVVVGGVSSLAAGGGGGLGGSAVTNYVKYVGGKAGPANNKLAPVQIGFYNQQGGAI